MKRVRGVLGVVLLAVSAGVASGQVRQSAEGMTPAELFPWARFDPSIPTQEQVTGVAHGGRPLRHGEIVGYLEALAEASPRATLRTYSHTHEGRRLVYLVVSEPDVQSDIDGFREKHVRLADPRGREPGDDAAALAGHRAVAWMAYAIHGDELSSADAATALAYWLVAGEDDRARTLRRELVVLIDPLENPDGRDRYLAQIRSFAHKTPSPDLEDLSHTSVWPWGRGNHYLFDLNRDWFTMVHPESRRSEVIASWLPQLMVDSHEMGANDTYLFPPPRHPFNPHLPPGELPWLNRFAADQARALDERGYPYYTREWNEEFFPGYGSSWSVYHGAIGILYEMSRTSGTVVRKRSGETRDYAQAVEHQVTSSVANLETLARHREEILLDFVRDRRAAVRDGETGDVRAWLLPPGRHPERTQALATLLMRQGLEVLRAAEPLTATGLRDARTGEVVEGKLPAGTVMVPLDQPSGRLARVLLDPHVPMESIFLREEREYQERGRGTRLYETTAWSLPLAFGIEAYWAGARPAGKWRAGPSLMPTGTVQEDRSEYGWVIDGTSDRTLGALADLLEDGIAVRVVDRPFEVDGLAFERGSLLIKREGNPDDLEDRLDAVAAHWGIEILATPTALATDGPDLGGKHFRPLVAPRVGVLTGMPVEPSEYGHLWHLFDQVLELRFSAIDIARFATTDLRRYNVLVLPPIRTYRGDNEPPPEDRGGAAYRHTLGEKGIERLDAWIRAGGTVVGIAGGAEFLADAELELTKTRLRRQSLEHHPPAVLGVDARAAAAGGPLRANGLRTDSEEDAGKSRRKASTTPYDIAPVLGPGARPFAAAVDLGAPAPDEPVSLAEWIRPLLPSGKDVPDIDDLKWADRRLRRFSPQGAFLRVELDADPWLNWGLPSEITAWVGVSDTFVAESPEVTVAARFPTVDRMHLGGLLWPEAAARLSHTAYCTRERVGHGQVILYLHNPVFRGWMHETRRHFVNAVLYGPGLGAHWPSPW